MEIGEPSGHGPADASTTDEGPLRFEIVLQDIPGPDGVPLAFTPWSLHIGGKQLVQGVG